MRLRTFQVEQRHRFHLRTLWNLGMDGDRIVICTRRCLYANLCKRHVVLGNDRSRESSPEYALHICSLFRLRSLLPLYLQELFTDTVPCLDKCDNPYIFISHISKGRYPDYPGSPAAERGLSLDMWHLLLRCWSPLPSLRPSAASVVSETIHIRYASSWSCVI